MSKCKNCANLRYNWCENVSDSPDENMERECVHFRQMANADRIRSMSDEELAELLLDGCRGTKCDDQPQNEFGSVNCFQCRLTWLQQPAENPNVKKTYERRADDGKDD